MASLRTGEGEQAISFKVEMYQLGVTLGKLCQEAGVEIRLNTRVDRAYAEQINADALIIAVGSEPFVPSIPGLADPQVVQVNDYHHRQHEIGHQVVILGGGLAGSELAVHLARAQHTVHLVEMNGELAPDANVRHRPQLLAEIDKQGIQVHCQHKAVEITRDGVWCLDAAGERLLIPGQSVVCALGQRSRRAAVDELLDAAPLVAQIGDCVKVSTITTAVYQGHHAALDI